MLQPDLFRTDFRTALLSRDRVYRYELWRRWSDGGRYVQFVCLNPSTADEQTDDPTVKKCVKLAQLWGYDAICITNLFAYRATDPRAMMNAPDPVGLGNNRHLKRIAADASLVVAAWGRWGTFHNRSAIVREMLRKYDLHFLRITADEPWHPLYLPDSTRPKRWFYSRGF